MQYFLIPLVFIIYLEIIGSVISSKLKLKSNYNAIIGFMAILSFYYIGAFPMLYFGIHSKFLFIFGAALLALFLAYTLINYKLISFKFRWSLVIIIVFVCIQVYFAYNSTLGDTGWYDASFYLNYVSDTTISESLNRVQNVMGAPGMISSPYFFQSFYHFFANVYVLVKPIFSIVGFDLLTVPMYVWTASVLFYYLLISVTLNFMDYFKLKITVQAILLMIVCGFIGNMYWNNEFAFFGNSYRLLFSTYVLFSVYNLIKKESLENYSLLMFSTLALCASTSTGLFMCAITMFALFCTLVEKRKNIVYFLVLIYGIPLINLSMVVLGIRMSNILITIGALILLACMARPIHWLFSKYKLSKVLVIVMFLIMFSLSLYVSDFNLNLGSFFNNWSGISDMTWDYFRFDHPISLLFNGILWISIVVFYKKITTSVLSKFFMVLVICIFNPLTITIVNQLFPVFYRAYDLLINPMTLAALALLFQRSKGFKYLHIPAIGGALVLMIYQSMTPYDSSFIPSINFDKLHRIEATQLDVIMKVKSIVDSENIAKIKVITDLYYLRAYVPQVETLYGRNGARVDDTVVNELYKIFFPQAYFGDPNTPKDAKYDQLESLVFESDYRIIIQDKRKDLYNEEENYYYPFVSLLQQTGVKIYENEIYEVRRISDE